MLCFKMSSDINTKFAFLSDKKGLGDLKSKSYAELTELLERQDHLLLNKSLINKLKDKGEKIRKTKDEILQELDCRKTKVFSSKKPIGNNSSVEWKDSERNQEHVDNSYVEEETDAMKLMSENGQIPNHNSHITMLIEKEREPDFSFKPYNSVVAEKIKKVVPGAHTVNVCPNLIKTVHLDESLNLLSQQMSALKVIGSRSKRVEECIVDRLNESAQDQDVEYENEETDEQETKVGSGISVNVNMSD